MIFPIASLETGRVDPAPERVGDLQGEVGPPGRILQVVAVEVDGAVFRGGLIEVRFPPAPVVPGDGTGRHVDGGRVQLVRAQVPDPGGVHLPGKVPGGDQVLPVHLEGKDPLSQLLQFLDPQAPSEEAGSLELAVIEFFPQDASVEAASASGRHQQGGVAVERRPAGKRAGGAASGGVGAGSETLVLAQEDLPAGNIDGGCHEIPVTASQSPSGREAVAVAVRAAHVQLQVSPGSQPQPVSGPIGRPPLGDQPLPFASVGSRGEDPGLQGERVQTPQRGPVGNRQPGSAVDLLPATRVGALDRGGNDFLLVARPGRILVSVDETHDGDLVPGQVGADLECQLFSGGNAELVAVADELCRHGRGASFRHPHSACRPYPTDTDRNTGLLAESGLIRLALYWIQRAFGGRPSIPAGEVR